MTLKLTPIASNMTQVESGPLTVLFSYKTPVACHINGEGFYRTSHKWSVTTSRHINKWLSSMRAQAPMERDQSFFDCLLNTSEAA
jgi:hypothetical protein